MRTLVLATAAGLLATPAFSAERYQLEKSERGYVRLDTETGEMSICEERRGQLVCSMAADERTAYDEETSRLADQVTSLEQRVAKLEKLASKVDSVIPSDEDIDRTIGMMQKFFRGFLDVTREMEKGLGGNKPVEPAPDRT